jgi:hypothetical protein
VWTLRERPKHSRVRMPGANARLTS